MLRLPRLHDQLAVVLGTLFVCVRAVDDAHAVDKAVGAALVEIFARDCAWAAGYL